ncbi:J domain-containing protein [Pseudomonas sp. Ma2-10]
MNCWAILGLAADADSRSIKRQYATLLKVHRPDEDPSGFQRLREAYEQAMEWSRREPVMPALSERGQAVGAQSPLPSFGHTLDFEHDRQPFGPSAGQQRAAQLLEDVTIEKLEQRLAQARVSHCVREFEDQLLMMCLEQRDDGMLFAEWGLEQFNWLSTWQRQDLSPQALALLHQAYCRETEKRLREQLDGGQVDTFIETFLALKRADWLLPFERHDWFNETLARVLAESNFWSTKLFETLCSHQQWNPGEDQGRCPQPYWSMLQEKHPYQAFLDELRHVATLGDHKPQSRAARLFLSPMTAAERKAFARRFFEADWNACRLLSEKIKRLHPQLCRELPDTDPYFWKALVQSKQTWPVFAGVFGASLAWTAFYPSEKSGIGDSAVAILFWLCVRAAPSAVLLVALSAFVLGIWCTIADRFWPLDVRLSRPVAHRLSFRRPPPLLLRELLPCWLIGGLTWAWFGVEALIAYAGVLLLLGALSRITWPAALSIRPSKPRMPVLGSAMSIALMVGVIGLTGLVYTIASSQLMGRDQGLQPFAKRGCSGPLDSRVECRIPPTQKQWYGQSDARKARP